MHCTGGLAYTHPPWTRPSRTQKTQTRWARGGALQGSVPPPVSQESLRPADGGPRTLSGLHKINIPEILRDWLTALRWGGAHCWVYSWRTGGRRRASLRFFGRFTQLNEPQLNDWGQSWLPLGREQPAVAEGDWVARLSDVQSTWWADSDPVGAKRWIHVTIETLRKYSVGNTTTLKCQNIKLLLWYFGKCSWSFLIIKAFELILDCEKSTSEGFDVKKRTTATRNFGPAEVSVAQRLAVTHEGNEAEGSSTGINGG